MLVLLAYGGLMGADILGLRAAPTGFIPEQDQGRLIMNVQLPDSASVQRTQEVMAQVEKIARRRPGVAHTITVSGLSFLLSANASNFGSMFVVLDPFDERRQPRAARRRHHGSPAPRRIAARSRRRWSRSSAPRRSRD